MVGSDTAQGRSDALFMVKKLHAKKVVIVDDQEAYSTGLAAAATAVLKANNVSVQRESVNQKVTDFSSLVTKVPSDANVVFLPWQVAANGQLFADQMLEQGKTAKVFGSDGLDSGDFTVKGAYVSSFARDIHGLPGTAAIIAGYNKKYGKKWSTFGPPSYIVGAGCRDGVQEGVRGRKGDACRGRRRTSARSRSRTRSSGSRSASTSTATCRLRSSTCHRSRATARTSSSARHMSVCGPHSRAAHMP